MMMWVKPQPKPREDKDEQRILTAFGQGQSAARKGKTHAACLYAPETQQELWQSWMCGYAEEDVVYCVLESREPVVWKNG
jgi:hypothetical protein